MSDAKIEVKIGEFCFSGQGNQEWLSIQLDKVIKQAKDIAEIAEKLSPQKQDATEGAANQNNGAKTNGNTKPLSTYLKDKNATSNQVAKFLATAMWVEEKYGKNRMKTSDISSALKSANQGRLSNPAECLNQNVGKGHCEKEGDSFFVTQEGRDALGIR